MRAKSRNLVVRQIPADQRIALFLKAVKEFPVLEAVLDEIKEENLTRKNAGLPLDASVQRATTAEQIGELAGGVGATTVKEVTKLEKEAPDKFEEVAQGKTSAKKALKEVKERKRTQTANKAKTTKKKAKNSKAAASTQPPALTCTVQA